MYISRPIKPILWILFSINFTFNLQAQVVFEKGNPPSFALKAMKEAPQMVMPNLDYEQIVEEDKFDLGTNKPYRFGFHHEVNYNLENAGVWTTLANGDKVWRLSISAPEAQTINLNYKKYDLPIGAQLFIHNDSRKEFLGPFTSKNENENGAFATGFTKGSSCTIEYYLPATSIEQGTIEISGVVHGYRSIRNQVNEMLRAFQDSGQCNYDVDCAIGNDWQDQIKSVGLIMTSNNSRFCTGALINNTGDDCQSYFLSANHCFAGDSVGDVLNDIFMFNYDSTSPACPGIPTSDGPTNETVQGATVIAKSSDSDFCLLELTDNPLDFYDVYYSGWDRTNVASVGGTGIHHPSGDVKKISFENATLVSGGFSGTTNTHWEVPDWDNGTTEPGSSGSPLFDLTNKRIIGQLHGGGAACSGTSNNGQSDLYGKIFHSWDQNSTVDTEQLAPWLDPIGSGTMTMDGNDCSTPVVPTALFSPADGTSYTSCSAQDLDFVDNSAGSPTSWSWSFSGAGVSPASSTDEDPIVNVTATGTLTATLTVTNAQGTDMLTQTYPITIDNCVIDSYCETPNLAIPDDDPTGISSTITVPASNNATDIDIDIDISHTYVGDLIIVVEHGGVTATILDRPGNPDSTFGCSEDDVICVFDDEGASDAETTCSSGGIAISGNVIPNDPLSVFDGMDPSGTWTITVSDNEGIDTGTLNSCCVTVTTDGGSTTPCYTNLTNSNGLLQFETGISDYESSDWISTTQSTIIQSSAIVDYDAVDFIDLNAPFEVEVGAVFEAFIGGCDNGGGGSNLSEEVNIDK